VGTVWFGLAWGRGADVVVTAEMQLFDGDRERIRRLSVERALQSVLAIEWGAEAALKRARE
jgi:nicotinamide mononucleotide (NMN) deamidase PncC